MATSTVFSQGVLTAIGDGVANSIVASRDAAGNILLNGGAVPVTGGQPTVANTQLIQILAKRLRSTIRSTKPMGRCPAPTCLVVTVTTP